MSRDARQNRNTRLTAGALVLVVAAMVGLVAVAEPLYRLFCQVTGYGGTPRIAEAGSDGIGQARVTVRFDANVNRSLDWRFRPVERQVDVRVGEERLAFYEATNLSGKPIVGTATFNVTPERAAIYFNKIECFCFTEQVLGPHETVRMPVTFFVDPEMMKDAYAREIKTITLSYTFFLDQDQSKARELHASSN